ncbi:hypothetical protein P886_1858 [Alteromonadaceae bacterium 2753L.S.0a.02]|nr:hypothetical protein P886_1858 [Alteromonadaceae bacterium 2753L.S.0a.02]
MKTDVLTLAAVIFVVGLIASGLGVFGGSEAEAEDLPPAELHQGIVVER